AQRISTEVNVFIAGEPGERDALSTFGREADKPFKGEPHERVMADLYLGLLRYRRGDHEGALSCFRSALNHDRGSFLLPVERHEARRGAPNVRRYLYEPDWALAWALACRSWLILGEVESAEEAFGNAVASRPEHEGLFQRVVDLENNVLVVIETGEAPRKRRTGPGGAELAYSRRPTAHVLEIRLGGEPLPFALA